MGEVNRPLYWLYWNFFSRNSSAMIWLIVSNLQGWWGNNKEHTGIVTVCS